MRLTGDFRRTTQFARYWYGLFTVTITNGD
jgi:hypothetical protein